MIARPSKLTRLWHVITKTDCPRRKAGYPCKLSRGLDYCPDCGQGNAGHKA